MALTLRFKSCINCPQTGALTYARDRMSMRSLSGTKAPEKVADPIIHHGDVRRMLLTCKVFTSGEESE